MKMSPSAMTVQAPPASADSNHPGQPGRTGSLKLDFLRTRVGHPALMRIDDQRWPLRVLRPFQHDGETTLVHLHNIGGGVLAGDQLAINIAAQDQAHVMVTSTSAQRIYKHCVGRLPSRQTMEVRVGPGARVEYLPDPNIPFNKSVFEQRATWHLARHGAMLTWDIIAPGRREYEEDFGFTSFGSEFWIYHDGQPICWERYRLSSGTALRNILRFSRWSHLGTLIFVDGGLDEAQCLRLEVELERQLKAACADQTGGAYARLSFGVSTLSAHGVIVRGLAERVETLNRLFAMTRDVLLTSAWGRSSPLPRKIY